MINKLAVFKLSIFLVVLSEILIFSCKKKNGEEQVVPEPPPALPPSMKATMNGIDWTVSTFSVTLNKFIDASGNYGKRLEIRGKSVENKELIISMDDFSSGHNGDCMKLRSYDYSGITDDALFTYKIGGQPSNYYNNYGKITLGTCDENKKLISGVFNVIFCRISPPPDTIRFSLGSFSNLPYTVY